MMEVSTRYYYSRQQKIFYTYVLRKQSTVMVHFTLPYQCLTRYSLSTHLLVMSCFRWYSPYFPKEILLHTTDSSHYSRILPADTTSTFLPEELVLTSSVHHAMQLPTHFQLQNYMVVYSTT